MLLPDPNSKNQDVNFLLYIDMRIIFEMREEDFDMVAMVTDLIIHVITNCALMESLVFNL